jgi:hypothetical protein
MLALIPPIITDINSAWAAIFCQVGFGSKADIEPRLIHVCFAATKRHSITAHYAKRLSMPAKRHNQTHELQQSDRRAQTSVYPLIENIHQARGWSGIWHFKRIDP